MTRSNDGFSYGSPLPVARIYVVAVGSAAFAISALLGLAGEIMNGQPFAASFCVLVLTFSVTIALTMWNTTWQLDVDEDEIRWHRIFRRPARRELVELESVIRSGFYPFTRTKARFRDRQGAIIILPHAGLLEFVDTLAFRTGHYIQISLPAYDARFEGQTSWFRPPLS